METPIINKYRLRTKSCSETSKSTNCCCDRLFHEVQSTSRKVDEILLFLRKTVSFKPSIISNAVQCDLIGLSEQSASDLQSSSIECQRNEYLSKPKFEVTYSSESSTLSRIENEIENSSVVDGVNHLLEGRVSTTPNDSNADGIISEFDPLSVKHESKTLKGHGNDSRGSKDSTCRLSVPAKKRKFDWISISDDKKSPRVENSSVAINSDPQYQHIKKLKKSPTNKEEGLMLCSQKNHDVTVGEFHLGTGDQDEQFNQSNEGLDYQRNSKSEEVNSSHESVHNKRSLDGKNSREDGFVDRYDKYSVYSNKTDARVYSKEVRTTIAENFSKINQNGETFFICKIDHDCSRSFNFKASIEFHIFSFFFLIQCPKCGRKFNRANSLTRHLKQC